MGKDKADMTWRHNSPQEKNLYKVVVALGLALAVFVVVVAVIDIQYRTHIDGKEKAIEAMESEIASLKTHVETLKAATVEMASLYTRLANITNNSLSSPPELTPTPPPPPKVTPQLPPNETVAVAETGSMTHAERKTEVGMERPTAKNYLPSSLDEGGSFVDSLRQLMDGLYKTVNSNPSHPSTVLNEQTTYDNGVVRQRGTILFLADISKENNHVTQNKPSITPEPKEELEEATNKTLEEEEEEVGSYVTTMLPESDVQVTPENDTQVTQDDSSTMEEETTESSA